MIPGRWEDVACPICPSGAGSSHYLNCSDRLNEPLLKNFRLTQCSECGLVFLNPRPASLKIEESHPQEGYDPFLSLQKSRGLFEKLYSVSREFTLAWKKRLVQRLVQPGGSILDIGCGTSEFLSVLKNKYRVMGVEPEPVAARWAGERFGLDVFAGDLSALPSDNTGLDLITMWHVLEHLPDPKGTLLDVASRLSPQGRLLIALPNISSFDARLYRAEWVALDAPRHLWLFSPQHLVNLAGGAGFELLRRGMLPLDAFYNILWSERLCIQTRGRGQLLIAPLRALTAAGGSLLWGALSGQHSGMYHIFVRR